MSYEGYDPAGWSRPPLPCPTPWTCGPDLCTGGCGADTPVVEKPKCLLCGDEWCPENGQLRHPVLLVDFDRPVQELPSYFCRHGAGADVVAFDGWCLVVDHATESFLVKMTTEAPGQAAYTHHWYDMQHSAMTVVVMPTDDMRAVRLWFTDLWRMEHSELMTRAR